jgi:mRNA interferase MazF
MRCPTIPLIGGDAKAQAEKFRSIATQHIVRRIGRISDAKLAKLDKALRLHLAL